MGKLTKKNQSKMKTRKNSNNWRVVLICLICAGLVAVVGFGLMNEDSSEAPSAETSSKKASADFNRLLGTWVRPDGGYVIEISKIHSDGTLEVAYFNPRAINVAKATVSEINGMPGLFIKLQDQGYPGSTYALKYNPDYDALVGEYFQAVMQQTFDVIFQRK